ncbi:MAG: VOC family protein [Puniceicoccales bacterium]|jgi:predicted enzyme related to lactoylglutathione lyase|nr:VOC family protein [Puniceicoccales bacterium]
MKAQELSTCFCTQDIAICRDFYERYFQAKSVFDCGWYINVKIGGECPSLQFMQPQGEMPSFQGGGVTLNFKADDVDTQYHRLVAEELQVVRPLEDHPWGDRGFSVLDPIGNSFTSIQTENSRKNSSSLTNLNKPNKVLQPTTVADLRR